MTTKTKLTNLIKYGTMNSPQQVDSKYMKPIFEKQLSGASFYSKEDELNITKNNKNTLSIWYAQSQNAPTHERIVLDMDIVYKDSVARDKSIDSYLRVDPNSNARDNAEVKETLKRIAKEGGIEKIIGLNNIDLE